MSEKSSEFVIKMEGIKLTPKDEERIAKVLQRAFVNELADVNMGGRVAIGIPKEWLGIWIEKWNRKDLIPNVRLTFGK